MKIIYNFKVVFKIRIKSWVEWEFIIIFFLFQKDKEKKKKDSKKNQGNDEWRHSLPLSESLYKMVRVTNYKTLNSPKIFTVKSGDKHEN